MPEPKPLPPHIPFAPTNSLIATLQPEDHGKVDVYIDDTVAIGSYLPSIIPRLAAYIVGTKIAGRPRLLRGINPSLVPDPRTRITVT